jgi:phosphate-selective porin OprO/OprP
MKRLRAAIVAGLALLAAPALARAQAPTLPEPPPPVSPAPLAPPPQLAPPAAVDPLTDLMQRVTFLEDELRKSKTRSADKPTVNWMMQLQIDNIWSVQDAANRAAFGEIPNGSAFRRARIGMFGDYGRWEYRIAMDFALSGHPSFIDNFIAFNDLPVLGRVRVGHFFEPFGLEFNSQNRFLTFLERSLPSEVLGQPRNIGLMANNNWAGDRGTWAAGIFRTDSDIFGNDVGIDFQSAGTGRVTYLLWYDEETQGRDLVHVGGSYSARAAKDNQVRFRARPEIRIGSAEPNIPDFADTGFIPADFYQLLNAELLWIRGPFSIQSEFQLMPVSTQTRGAVYFHSWYVLASVFLTGENRAYRKSTGVLERIYPRRDFLRRDCGGFAVGPGAWELACRVSHLDLDSGGIEGGRFTDLTVGVNWYLSTYLRMTANYIHAFNSPRQGPDGNADFFGLRMGYEF